MGGFFALIRCGPRGLSATDSSLVKGTRVPRSMRCWRKRDFSRRDRWILFIETVPRWVATRCIRFRAWRSQQGRSDTAFRLVAAWPWQENAEVSRFACSRCLVTASVTKALYGRRFYSRAIASSTIWSPLWTTTKFKVLEALATFWTCIHSRKSGARAGGPFEKLTGTVWKKLNQCCGKFLSSATAPVAYSPIPSKARE